MLFLLVIPAKAGIQWLCFLVFAVVFAAPSPARPASNASADYPGQRQRRWIPAFAGMTIKSKDEGKSDDIGFPLDRTFVR
ncbi:hypothetical protein ACFPN1_09140 [Lysobacter yangpyeongensis]|uniref:Secreted protein n=1 Tax=Lysobacter yangpyeongensis TaxID=346182 RepID=A0ABW0SNG6_9GAMM